MNPIIPFLFALGLFGLMLTVPLWFSACKGTLPLSRGGWAALILCIVCSGMLVGAARVLAGMGG